MEEKILEIIDDAKDKNLRKEIMASFKIALMFRKFIEWLGSYCFYYEIEENWVLLSEVDSGKPDFELGNTNNAFVYWFDNVRKSKQT